MGDIVSLVEKAAETADEEEAEKLGVPEVIRARNGAMVRLAPPPVAIIDDVPVGRLYRDGAIITRADDGQVRERRSCWHRTMKNWTWLPTARPRPPAPRRPLRRWPFSVSCGRCWQATGR